MSQLMMTSVIKQIGDLDRMDALRAAALDTYEKAVLSMAQYAVAVEPALVLEHRRRLENLRTRVAGSAQPSALQELQAQVRAELRDYQDHSESALGKLKQEYASAVTSLQGVMSGLSLDDSDHLKTLKNQLGGLETAASSADLATLRRIVNTSVLTIRDQVEAIQRENSLKLLAIQDDLRILQVRLSTAESSAAKDDLTGALLRSEFERRIRKAIYRGDRVLIPISRIQNYDELAKSHPRPVLDEILRAVYKRYRGTFKQKTDVGRWNEDTFVAMVPQDQASVMGLSRELASRLFPEYTVLDGERLIRARLRINTCVVASSGAEEGDAILARIEKGLAASPGIELQDTVQTVTPR